MTRPPPPTPEQYERRLAAAKRDGVRLDYRCFCARPDVVLAGGNFWTAEICRRCRRRARPGGAGGGGV